MIEKTNGHDACDAVTMEKSKTDAAILPHPNTKRGQIFAALRAGQRLTSLDAWLRFSSSRLAADINALRRAGHPIQSETVTVTGRDGRESRVAQYWLEA